MLRIMFMFIIVLLSGPLLATHAQDDGFIDVPHIITEVDVSIAEGDAFAIELQIVGLQTDACEEPIIVNQSVSGNVIDIQVYRKISIAQTCMRSDVAYETSLRLDDLDWDDGEYIVRVNGLEQPFSVETIAIESLEPTDRYGNIFIDTMRILHVDDRPHAVMIAGMLPDGCDLPVSVTQTFDGKNVVLDVARALPSEDQICTMEVPAFALAIVFDQPVEGPGWTISLNGTVVAEHDAEGHKIQSTIDSIEVLVLESFPMRLNVTVSGQHPDACDFPVMVRQNREGNTITLDVYRLIPYNVRCATEATPFSTSVMLDSNFVGGTYTIIGNDYSEDITIN